MKRKSFAQLEAETEAKKVARLARIQRAIDGIAKARPSDVELDRIVHAVLDHVFALEPPFAADWILEHVEELVAVMRAQIAEEIAEQKRQDSDAARRRLALYAGMTSSPYTAEQPKRKTGR